MGLKTTNVTLRMPQWKKEALEADAKFNKRSLNQHIEFLLDPYLKEMNTRKSQPPRSTEVVQ